LIASRGSRDDAGNSRFFARLAERSSASDFARNDKRRIPLLAKTARRGAPGYRGQIEGWEIKIPALSLRTREGRGTHG
jgi:hypothetical protein